MDTLELSAAAALTALLIKNTGVLKDDYAIALEVGLIADSFTALAGYLEVAELGWYKDTRLPDLTKEERVYLYKVYDGAAAFLQILLPQRFLKYTNTLSQDETL